MRIMMSFVVALSIYVCSDVQAFIIFTSRGAYVKASSVTPCYFGPERWEESNIDINPLPIILDGTLQSAVPNVNQQGIGFPSGLALARMIVMANMGPNPGAPIPNPRLIASLQVRPASAQAGYTELVVANQAVDSFDIVFQGCTHRAVGFDTYSLGGGPIVVISVFDCNNVMIHQGAYATVDNAGHPAFFGIMASNEDLPISRVNIYDPSPRGGGGMEGADDIIVFDNAMTGSYTFEPPTYSGSVSGVSVTGQDHWINPVAGSTDGLVLRNGDNLNVYELRHNPGGGAQFLGQRSAGGNAFARSQHFLCLTDRTTICYDIIARFNGTLPASPIAGSFTLQPFGNPATTRSFAQQVNWVNASTANKWNAFFFFYDADGTLESATPGAAWEQLDANRWYRLCTSFDFRSNRITQLQITNIETNATTTLDPVDWYVGGGAMSTLDRPHELRLAATGSIAGNIVGWDNLIITPIPRCPCDFDDDGTVNSQDFFDYLRAFFMLLASADFNLDGTVNSQDFFDFIACFFGGCS